MEESSAPPVDLEEEDALPEGRSLTMAGGFRWGNVQPVPPGYGPMSPYPPQFPPPYYTPPSAEGGGLYPVIGFHPPGLYPRPAVPAPPAPFYGNKPYMECPICRQVLMKPIYQCHNGHVICTRCIDTIEFCTQCEASLTGPKIRNIHLEQVIEGQSQGLNFYEVKCPNWSDGCEVVTTTDSLRGHIEVCEFRRVPFCSKQLGLSHCHSEVNSSTILGHLRDAHQIQERTETKFNLKLIMPSDTLISHSSLGVIWDPIVVTGVLDHDVLLKYSVTPKGQLLANGYLLGGSIQDSKNYRVKFELNSKSKISRLEWTGSLLSFRQMDHGEHFLNVNSFQVSLELLREFTNDHNPDESELSHKLKMKVSIWKITDDDPRPFKECFRSLESGEKEPLEKITLYSSPPMEGHTFADTTRYHYDYDHTLATTCLSSFLPDDTCCTNCNRLISGVTYQCLQCPSTTYFCRYCIEGANTHKEHLTLRISAPEQIPLAAVAYECSSGEIA